ncbi:GNAT family N-acetyltransferase [Aliarcobacter butzleri]|uniref:GNAT family N-acetyltransferase n=1 Tax=Aliarcobacter butzleri TaxID=28197 RepID=UPI003B2225D3
MLDNIKIITDKITCENILRTKKSDKIIEGNYQYKKILNDFYSPEQYLFFIKEKDVIPLVIKDSLVSFYGGIHYNEYNNLPQDKQLVNFVLNYLKEHNLEFRLLSIRDDYYDILDDEQIDVPYGANWEIKDVPSYSLEDVLSQHNSKERNNLLRCIKKQDEYEIYLENDFSDLEKILRAMSDYFKNRNISFGWNFKEKLFIELIHYFKKNFNLTYKVLKKSNYIHGVYILIYNDNEVIYFFGGPLLRDNNISTLIYNDLLKEVKQLNIKKLDAMRGSFGYKKKFGFKPKPLYALVSDNRWNKMLDSDFSIEEYNKLFNRNIDLEI